MFYVIELELLTAKNLSVEDLEQLQTIAADSGFIHDPVFYSGKVGAKYLLGGVWQVVSTSAQDAIILGIQSFRQLVEELLPEENPYDELVHFSTYLQNIEEVYGAEPVPSNEEV